MAYDTKCYDLAAAFLDDSQEINSERNRRRLAQRIQDTIEDQLDMWQQPCDTCRQPLGKSCHKGCIPF